MAKESTTPPISSPRNPLVRSLIALRKASERRESGLSLVEGFQILRLAVQAGSYPQTVLFVPDSVQPSDNKALEQAQSHGAAIVPVTPRVMEHLSEREGPLGVMATVPIRYAQLKDLPVSNNSLLLVAEGLEQPGNIGVLIRTASAAGAQGVILADSQADAFAPAGIHASLGAIFAIPIINCSADEAVKWLRQHEVQIVAATPVAKLPYFEADLTRSTVVAVGNEHRGLSPVWLQDTVPVRIPMAGPMNSLNATTAGAVILFDAARQRNSGQAGA